MTTVKAPESGKFEVRGDKLDLVTVIRGKIVFNVTDTSKYWYEKGYTKEVRRVINKKDKTFRYGGHLIDLSKVNGIEAALS
jgi:hypothetical protein